MSEPVQEEEFGAGLPLLDKLKLLSEWAPLLARFQAVVTAETPYEQARAIVKAAQWAAGKSATEVDDEALEHIEAVLKTTEGKAGFEWFVGKVVGGL